MSANPPAGATPVAAGATPVQTPATPAPTPTTTPDASATDVDGLGEAGRRALKAERDARAAAEKQRDEAQRRFEDLENASKSDHEKALAQAKRDGAAEVATRYQDAIRRSEVRAALIQAGLAVNLVDLASRSDQFTELRVTDAGAVQGLDAAIEAFRKATPELFAKPTAPRSPDFGGGPRGAPATDGTDMNTIIRRAAGRA